MSTVAVIGFSNVSVSEDMGMVPVCVTVERPQTQCPIDFPFNISFSTIDDEAGGCVLFLNCPCTLHAFCLHLEISVSPDDFTAFEATRKFPVCSSSLCVNISINDDIILEKDELFQVFVMVENQQNIILYQSDVFVLVKDNKKGVNWCFIFLPIRVILPNDNIS